MKRIILLLAVISSISFTAVAQKQTSIFLDKYGEDDNNDEGR